MALPQQLKTARATNDTLGVDVDNVIGAVESVLCDIFGFTPDSNISESPFNLDNAGNITKALLKQVAAGPVGYRFRDSVSAKEFRLALNGTNVLVDENTGTEEVPVWTNRATMALATGVWTLAGAAFTAIPTGPNANPTTDNEFARKKYVNDQDTALGVDTKVSKTGDETIAGVKTFSSIPILPASDPTTANEATRKAYVDSLSFSPPYACFGDQKADGTLGGQAVNLTWTKRDINTEWSDTENIVSISGNQFTLQAGTYIINSKAPFVGPGGGIGNCRCKMRLRNVTDGTTTIVGQSVPALQSIIGSVDGKFTIAAQKTFELQYFITLANNYDLGYPASSGEVEVYTVVNLWKVA
jgi:hypothetical protein